MIRIEKRSVILGRNEDAAAEFGINVKKKTVVSKLK